MDNEEKYKEILEKLETLPSSSQVDSLLEKLDEISDHVYTIQVFGHGGTPTRLYMSGTHIGK